MYLTRFEGIKNCGWAPKGLVGSDTFIDPFIDQPVFRPGPGVRLKYIVVDDIGSKQKVKEFDLRTALYYNSEGLHWMDSFVPGTQVEPLTAVAASHLMNHSYEYQIEVDIRGSDLQWRSKVDLREHVALEDGRLTLKRSRGENWWVALDA